MNSLELKRYALLTIPFLLIPSTGFVYVVLSRWLGKEKGYLFGFLFYWAIWCFLIPLVLFGTKQFLSLFVDATPLFSRPNWPVAVLFIFITRMALFMYGRDFIHAPFALILIAIPAATINGICEELLWRGLYVKTFPDNFWLAILYPAIGFALWHLVPLQVFSGGNRIAFVISTFFLGLASLCLDRIQDRFRQMGSHLKQFERHPCVERDDRYKYFEINSDVLFGNSCDAAHQELTSM